jgi:hypothetical protein
MAVQVSNRSNHELDTVTESTEATIAVTAQDAPYFTGHVVVVDVNHAPVVEFQLLPTDGASSSLLLDSGLEPLTIHSVLFGHPNPVTAFGVVIAIGVVVSVRPFFRACFADSDRLSSVEVKL